MKDRGGWREEAGGGLKLGRLTCIEWLPLFVAPVHSAIFGIRSHLF